MEYIDLILLVIANTGEDYYCGFINEYWAKFIKYIEKNGYNIKIFLLFGNGFDIKHVDIDEKNIICAKDTKEEWVPGILEKTIFALDHINNTYNYKHILRTNLSSFFILDNLIKINNLLPDENTYAGVCVPQFVSGAAFWLSKDNIKYILNNKSQLKCHEADVVAIGDLLKTVKKTNLDRYDISYTDDYINIESILPFIKNHYHIRIKSKNRTVDVITMKNLTERFYLY